MDFTRFKPQRIYNSIRVRWWKNTRNLEKYAGYLYRKTFDKELNWQCPEDLNQWINWLEFKTDTSEWGLLADKYRVRDYIASKGFADNLVPLLAVWENPENIAFDDLPNKFVVKMNNGSGDVLVIRDKRRVDLTEIKKYFKNLFDHPFGIESAEPHYLTIKPCVIAEALLESCEKSEDSTSLTDYKFWCFDGFVYGCFICSNRTKNHIDIDLYTADDSWMRIEDSRLAYSHHYRKSSNPVVKPVGIKEMVRIASELSKGYPQMRVDFYEVDGKVYVGELTLSSAGGRMDYFTEMCLKEMGKLCGCAVENLNIM